ncbi:putative LOB domain-containing protein [Hibiscus syriacus]|uniref:LOB domain-containing protein n=1 Tax=Hibiscus syriacus TaxID=106335 RepID=A0A6A3CR82_HIBSY|nr:putative LOB domain-containing protein [Hibiscus syriacus]
MASVPEFSGDYSFPQFQNPLLIAQENCIDGIGGAIPSSATTGEEITVLPDIDAGYRLQDVCDEFGEECNSILRQDIKPVEPNMGENWGVQGNPTQDNNLKAVRYSVEERKDRILRYLNKRNRRNFNKTIKYACRKTVADRRVRVRGRFARNNTELCEDEMITRKEDDNNASPIDKNLNHCEAVQIKHDELDDWLQEALADLIY